MGSRQPATSVGHSAGWDYTLKWRRAGYRKTCRNAAWERCGSCRGAGRATLALDITGRRRGTGLQESRHPWKTLLAGLARPEDDGRCRYFRGEFQFLLPGTINGVFLAIRPPTGARSCCDEKKERRPLTRVRHASHRRSVQWLDFFHELHNLILAGRPKSRRAQLGVAVPQLGQPTPCAIRILRRSGEDGARRHRDASKKHMKYNPALEAELLLECNGQR